MAKKKMYYYSNSSLRKKSMNTKKTQTISNENSDPEAIDHSIIGEPLNLSVKNVDQILTCLNNGTNEVKDLILNECNIIYECRICRNLFRSLANFIAHKRIYCKEHYCEKMVLFDPASLKLPSGMDDGVFNHLNKGDSKLDPGSLFPDKKDKISPISNQNKRPKRSLEDIVGRLNQKVEHESNQNDIDIARSNDQNKIKRNQKSTVDIDLTNFSELKARFDIKLWQILRKECAKINYECSCGTHCPYISNAITHLLQKHKLPKFQAKVLIYSFYEQKKNKIQEINTEKKCDEIDNDQQQNEALPNGIVSEHVEKSPASGCASIEKSSSIITELQNSPQSDPISALVTSQQKVLFDSSPKRYKTRHTKRKSCSYDCNDVSCFYSKHCKQSSSSTGCNTAAKQTSLAEFQKSLCSHVAEKVIKSIENPELSKFNLASSSELDSDSEEIEIIYESVKCTTFDTTPDFAIKLSEFADYERCSCSLCPSVNFSSVICLQQHITMRHLKKPIFACLKCSLYSNTCLVGITHHLQASHGIEPENNKMYFTVMNPFLTLTNGPVHNKCENEKSKN